MNESTFEIRTPEGQMETFAAWPEAPAEHPAVILYMDAPGIREELRDFCRRIADHGHCAVLPDLYYRLGKKRFDLAVDDRAEIFACMRSLDNALVMRDTGAILEHLARMPQVSSGPKGCIGYCMSGQYVISAAGTYPSDFAAIASLHGVGIVTDRDDSPHLLADRIEGELYFGFAQDDDYVPESTFPPLRDALDQYGVRYRLDVWPDTVHGFCFPERGPLYNESAAEGVWESVFDLYARRLPGGGSGS